MNYHSMMWLDNIDWAMIVCIKNIHDRPNNFISIKAVNTGTDKCM